MSTGGRLAGAALLGALALASPAHGFEIEERQVDADPARGLEPRRMFVGLPDGVGNDERIPAIVLLHGAGRDALDFLETTGWPDTAEEARFAVIAPEAAPLNPARPAQRLHNPRVWNAGENRSRSRKVAPDDTAQVLAAIEVALDETPIDPARIYLVGFGNGGAMAQRIVMQGTPPDGVDGFAGLASVAGTLHGASKRVALPVWLLYGGSDPLLPLDGGIVTTPWSPDARRPAPRETISAWHQALGCPDEPAQTEEETGISTTRWRDCRGGTNLDVVMVDGLGHHWPGTGTGPWPERVAGPADDTIFAPWEIWHFFERDREHHG